MRVLLAQTDRDAMAIFTTALEAEGHQVVAVQSGEQAIRVAMEQRPEVIVTELVLPMVDGWQVLEVLRTHEPSREVPVLALTSYVESDGESRAVAAGFAAYLTLPIEPLALVEAVERATAPPLRPPGKTPAAADPRHARRARGRVAE